MDCVYKASVYDEKKNGEKKFKLHILVVIVCDSRLIEEGKEDGQFEDFEVIGGGGVDYKETKILIEKHYLRNYKDFDVILYKLANGICSITEKIYNERSKSQVVLRRDASTCIKDLNAVLNMEAVYNKMKISPCLIPCVNLRKNFQYNVDIGKIFHVVDENWSCIDEDAQIEVERRVKEFNEILNKYNQCFEWIDDVENKNYADKINQQRSIKNSSGKVQRKRKKNGDAVNIKKNKTVISTRYSRLADGVHFTTVWRKKSAEKVKYSIMRELKSIKKHYMSIHQ